MRTNGPTQLALVLGLAWAAPAFAQAPPALLAQNYAMLKDSVCPAAGGETQFPPRAAQGDPHMAPAKVFDNLYFVGSRTDTAYALTTSEGIILFDAMFPYEVQDYVVGGLKTLGLDPADIRYVVVAHAHADHFGGAAFLQETYGARVAMSAADWDDLPDATPDTPTPRRDVVIEDGGTLTLGDTTVRFVLTPGHTQGTVSSLIPLKDGAAEHLGALWGGTALSFAPREDVEKYLRSLAKLRNADPKIDVVLSNHAYADGTELKMAALKERAPGGPHPYVVGGEGFRAWLDVLQGCAEEWLERKK